MPSTRNVTPSKVTPIAAPTKYEPWAAETHAEVHVERCVGSDVYALLSTEHNAQGRLVFDQCVTGRIVCHAASFSEIKLELVSTFKEPGGETHQRVDLSLRSDKTSLTHLALFADALRALVNDSLAQGANREDFNTAGVSFTTALDPSAKPAPVAVIG